MYACVFLREGCEENGEKKGQEKSIVFFSLFSLYFSILCNAHLVSIANHHHYYHLHRPLLFVIFSFSFSFCTYR